MSEPAQHSSFPIPPISSPRGDGADSTASPTEKSSSDPNAQWTRSLHRRYGDAYTVALSIVAQGERLKFTALVAWVLISVLFFVMTLAVMKETSSSFPLAGLIVGVVIGGFVGAVIYGYGVRLAAEGQQLLASLDTAVNTSRFLSDHDRATIMRL